MPYKKTTFRLCDGCGVEYATAPAKAQTSRYCNRACYSKYRPRGADSPKWKEPSKGCEQCGSFFKPVKACKERFCSRSCYSSWCRAGRKCKDCGKSRCKEHSRQKTAKWRATATKEELKARSLQQVYRKATGQQLTFHLSEARELIKDTPICPYCRLQIPWAELSIDHRIPTSRGGNNDPSNLVWTDLECNIIKGNLMEDEFLALLKFLEYFPEMKTILARRLKAGGFMYSRRKHNNIKYRD